jgi:CSLREA domain-containing protein
LLALAMVALSLLAAKPAYAKTFTVNITGDTDDGKCEPWTLSSSCSLREAIKAANEASGQDTIAFNILTTGVKTLTPDSPLPPITGPVTIDGYTQRPCSNYAAPCSKPNTNAQGAINAKLLIELDGSSAGTNTTGLIIDSSNTVIKGLVINSFEKSGIRATANATGIKVRGSFIGTDASGTSDLGNGNLGVSLVGASGNTVGGTTPEARNLISGNASSGIYLGGSNNKVEGNLIGTDISGALNMHNLLDGVTISGNNNLIGGAASAANTIAINGLDGVHVFSGNGNRILSNSIAFNGELGIDLSGGVEDPPPVKGITLNDLKDADTGPNGLQNYPYLSEAKANPNGTTTITGTLNSRPEKTYTIQFFSSDVGDPDGFGEGEDFLGQKKVETNKKGNASFTFTTTLPEADDRISATATGGSGTSEFAHWINQ